MQRAKEVLVNLSDEDWFIFINAIEMFNTEPLRRITGGADMGFLEPLLEEIKARRGTVLVN